MTGFANDYNSQIALPKAEASRLIEEICATGDCLRLRAQQRVPLPPADKLIMLREGMLAIDAMPAKGKLQVLDFLMAGDVVSASTVLPSRWVSLRAITSASLVALSPPEFYQAIPAHGYWTFLIARCFNQLARVNIHQLITGRLETEQRVASFILALALRNIREDTDSIRVALPMSRNDIANYLVINCDTLSRTMMRLCDGGIIKRENRHYISVIDIDGLKKKSPISALLSAVFDSRSRRPEPSNVPIVDANLLSTHENDRIILPANATGIPSRSSSQLHHASQRGQ
jgi:CRP/FNR family transcriptional regulator